MVARTARTAAVAMGVPAGELLLLQLLQETRETRETRSAAKTIFFGCLKNFIIIYVADCYLIVCVWGEGRRWGKKYKKK